MNPYRHIAVTLERSRDGLLEWMRGLLAEAGMDLPVVGALSDATDRTRLLLLPYQTVLESQSAAPFRPLVPMPDSPPGSVPPDWMAAASAMTEVLMELYPRRPKKAAGLGPLDPRPRLDALPGPIADWYRAQGGQWLADPERGLLPSVQWRQPFSFVVRYAGLVVDPDPLQTDVDQLRLMGLGVLAAGVRYSRFFEVSMPPGATSPELLDLLTAMRDGTEGQLRERLQDALDAVQMARQTAVGVYPHHELSDADLAFVARALKLPMQPAVVFAVRFALGAGPVLDTGAIPAIPPMERTPEKTP